MKQAAYFFAVFLISFSAVAEPLRLRVVNFDVAQAGFSSAMPFERLYLQDGRVQKPDAIDYSKPYCHSFGDAFRLDGAKIYRVTAVENFQPEDSELWEMSLILDPQSSAADASFVITCFPAGTQVPTLDDAKIGLTGIYEILGD